MLPKIKLKLKKRKICKETEKNVLILKHDRYLARAHTLIGVSGGFVVSLLFLIVSGKLEGFIGFDRGVIYVYCLAFGIIFSLTLTLYLWLKSERIEIIERFIDLSEGGTQINKT